HQAHRALSDFRGKLAWLLVHGSILSRVGASTKLGAVHNRQLQGGNVQRSVTFACLRSRINVARHFAHADSNSADGELEQAPRKFARSFPEAML
ncbi:hypothetical protein, partial [Burkholderia sp. TSV86]|uniref:hypothetical protein n=1 Tax=Burkholderia sp. TSV86 TaxID=1385594 RepID=UPI001E4E03B7